LLLAITYSNVVGILQGGVSGSRVSFSMAFWVLHISVFLLSVLLLYWRDNTNSHWHPARLLGSLRSRILSLRGASA
jgi:hypothetical protein